MCEQTYVHHTSYTDSVPRSPARRDYNQVSNCVGRVLQFSAHRLGGTFVWPTLVVTGDSGTQR